RRAKATSNICTNQGLLVTAATIYMALLGPEGLRRVATASASGLRALSERLLAIPGVERLFPQRAGFHELAIRLPKPATEVIDALALQRIVAGVDLGDEFPGLENALLVCVTETKTEADLDRFAKALADAVA